MKLQIKKGSTDVTVYVFVQDSSSTVGAGLTGLVFNTASLVAKYVRPLAASATLTLATQTVTGAHSAGGFVEVDDTDMKGVYRLDLSDAIIATGVNSVVLMLSGAANMAPLPIEIELVAYDPQDAVRMGLTAIPNAAADAAGGLPISDAGGLDLDTKLANTNEVTVARMGALTDWLNGGRLDLLLDAIPTTPMRGTDNALLASSYTAPDNAGIANNGTAIAAVPTAAENRIEMDDSSAQIGSGATLDLSNIIFTTTGSTDTISFTGSGSGNGFGFPRSGAGDPWDTAFITQMQNGLSTLVATDIVSAGAITTLSGSVVNVDLTDTLTTYTGNTVQTGDSFGRLGVAGAGLTNLGGMSTGMKAEVQAADTAALNAYDPPTNAEMEARTPTASQLAYMVDNSAEGVPVTFTTSGGSTTAAVLALVDGGAGSATDDQYNGRLLLFTDGTLEGVVTDITDYVGSTTTATITAIPFAPTATHNARLL